jgi:glycosyltransferase involved in cell wall biosynthesis
VEALKEIEEDSGGAAELFPAGDPESLAALLETLLHSPERRQQMARQGAEWVRGERTWSNNARTYVQAYRTLGWKAPSKA